MPTKETTPLRSSRRRASRTPSKRLVALPGGASKQPASRPAAVAARLRPKRSRARGKPGFPASLGKAFGDLTSRLSRELSRGAGKKRLAAVLTGAAGALAASVAFVRRRGRRAEPPATEPTPQTTAATIPQQEGDEEPASDTTSAPTNPRIWRVPHSVATSQISRQAPLGLVREHVELMPLGDRVLVSTAICFSPTTAIFSPHWRP